MDGPNNVMVADSNTFLVLLNRGTLHRIEQVTENSYLKLLSVHNLKKEQYSKYVKNHLFYTH